MTEIDMTAIATQMAAMQQQLAALQAENAALKAQNKPKAGVRLATAYEYNGTIGFSFAVSGSGKYDTKISSLASAKDLISQIEDLAAKVDFCERYSNGEATPEEIASAQAELDADYERRAKYQAKKGKTAKVAFSL